MLGDAQLPSQKKSRLIETWTCPEINDAKRKEKGRQACEEAATHHARKHDETRAADGRPRVSLMIHFNRRATSERLVAAPATAATAASATTTAAVSTAPAATAATIFTRARFIDIQLPAAQILAIHGLDRFFGSVFHLDKAEASRAARFTIRDHGCRTDGTEFAERIAKFVRCRSESQISHIKFLSHFRSQSRAGSLQKNKTRNPLSRFHGRSSLT
jgi:hypothetical protein